MVLSLPLQLELSAFYIEKSFIFFTKQATLTRRSMVLSLPLQLEFPGSSVFEVFLNIFLDFFVPKRPFY